MSDLLTIRDLDPQALRDILALSAQPECGRPLAGKGVAMVFQKPSARTRNSMEMAVVQLGGHPVYIQKDEVGLGTRETAEDVANTLACYHGLIAGRVMDHEVLEQMAAAVETPVLNMLSDSDHPLQALADLLTVQQLLGTLDGARIAYIGDANNVARSLAEACAKLGVELRIASPDGYGFPDAELASYGGAVTHTADPAEAVRGAQFVYTDVWVSMGQDDEAAARQKALAPYQVNETLMGQADEAWFLHCLPARRGEEVTDGVIDGARSAVWRQATNRMHTARGAMAWMMGVRP
ncbi:ornithine carbamoyltransferase [Sphingomonas sp. LY54]|uniref:ornithine carbamoyltransferase n=1 Tax=Sphingomonas sp. LY54 TaxID=3095343 RepID=UPI002D765377|nr:ornithine carbamoyltransferase [Sphingomonas sp. LY54]WRP29650.1 ornithine carbamoyltransferase [Sphingomonas sp. LY54]